MAERRDFKPRLYVTSKSILEEMDKSGDDTREKIANKYEVITPKMIKKLLADRKNQNRISPETKTASEQFQKLNKDSLSYRSNPGKTDALTDKEISRLMMMQLNGELDLHGYQGDPNMQPVFAGVNLNEDQNKYINKFRQTSNYPHKNVVSDGKEMLDALGGSKEGVQKRQQQLQTWLDTEKNANPIKAGMSQFGGKVIKSVSGDSVENAWLDYLGGKEGQLTKDESLTIMGDHAGAKKLRQEQQDFAELQQQRGNLEQQTIRQDAQREAEQIEHSMRGQESMNRRNMKGGNVPMPHSLLEKQMIEAQEKEKQPPDRDLDM